MDFGRILRNFLLGPPTEPLVQPKPPALPPKRVAVPHAPRHQKSDFAPVAPPPPPEPSLIEVLQGQPSGVLLPTSRGYRVVTLSDAGPLALPKSKPPSAAELQTLAGSRPVMVVARGSSSEAEDRTEAAYAVIVPRGFDASPPKPYSVVLATLPEGMTFQQGLRALSGQGQASRDNAVVLICEREAAGKGVVRSPLEVAQIHALEDIRQFPVDFSSIEVMQLPAETEEWGATLRDAPTARVSLPCVWLNDARGFRAVPPTRNWREGWGTPSVNDVLGIPPERLKQQETRGTFFAPTVRVGEKSAVRIGVYLPPGYDPALPERYPILLLLPGFKNPLHYWTSAGQLVPHLDHLMAGDAQKMVVLIPDDHSGKVSADALYRYGVESFNTDPERISVSGISMGTRSALDFVRKHEGRVRSVGLHSGVVDRIEKEHRPALGSAEVLVDAGADETRFRENLSRLAVDLKEAGIPAQVSIHQSDERKVGHGWANWERQVEAWIAFHQSSHGPPGLPRRPDDVTVLPPDKVKASSWKKEPQIEEW